jgi:exopolysaccharide biosynthesis predicted pyruvyltransferase EpsI
MLADPPSADLFVFGGGGSMGSLWPHPLAVRRELYALAAEHGRPVLILPQSFAGEEECLPPGAQVFLRDHLSRRYCDGPVVPDLALLLDIDPADYPPPHSADGLFLRADREAGPESGGADPIHNCHSTDAYFRLAAGYAHIITNRLHFAICGLHLGRRVTLLPNSYHKNRGVYESWLEAVGCEWAHSAIPLL